MSTEPSARMTAPTWVPGTARCAGRCTRAGAISRQDPPPSAVRNVITAFWVVRRKTYPVRPSDEVTAAGWSAGGGVPSRRVVQLRPSSRLTDTARSLVRTSSPVTHQPADGSTPVASTGCSSGGWLASLVSRSSTARTPYSSPFSVSWTARSPGDSTPTEPDGGDGSLAPPAKSPADCGTAIREYCRSPPDGTALSISDRAVSGLSWTSPSVTAGALRS